MDYYKLLQLDREPFSNSPDPDYFYPSRQHVACLQKLELALRLKRGLNVVIGDVGTGKTTLCRQLIRKFSDDAQVESYLILDPSFDSTQPFLLHLHELICGYKDDPALSDLALKENIKQHLFKKGVDEHKTVVLIIDEGQKTTDSCLEILRELLNFETNTYKLLQIVIFAQLEFKGLLDRHVNFSDRINLLHYLAPMDFKDTRRMVNHRIKLSSAGPRPQKIFTRPALWAIYRSSRGYPRKIIHICHQSILAMIIQNRSTAGWALIRSCKKRLSAPTAPTRRAAVLFTVLLLVGSAFYLYNTDRVGSGHHDGRMQAIKIYPKADPSIPAAIDIPTAAGIPPQLQGAENSALAGNDAASRSIASGNLPAEAYASGIEKKSGPAPQTDADTGKQKPVQNSDPPASLGRLIVKPGDTLVDLVFQVYGTRQNAFLRAVIDANRQIADPNVIDIGNVLSFPPLSRKIRPAETTPVYWVKLGDYQSLPQAAQQVHQISSTTSIPVHMIPAWSPTTGLHFPLLVKRYFTDARSAADYADALPENNTGQAEVMSSWPNGTIFYADPYAGSVH